MPRSLDVTDLGEVEESEKAESIVTVDVVLTFESVLTRSEGGGMPGGKAKLLAAGLGSIVSMFEYYTASLLFRIDCFGKMG
mmetsp:Transcript_9808/g.20287  ORF Transcript_9808/g.20287 Transcript_9808/m.20287 type:complete len:81 (+) Transcript_9808:1184-1426(+)